MRSALPHFATVCIVFVSNFCGQNFLLRDVTPVSKGKNVRLQVRGYEFKFNWWIVENEICTLHLIRTHCGYLLKHFQICWSKIVFSGFYCFMSVLCFVMFCPLTFINWIANYFVNHAWFALSVLFRDGILLLEAVGNLTLSKSP